MEFKKQPFIPMLFGGDINTYSVARAFYEEYQVKTYVFGSFQAVQVTTVILLNTMQI